MRIVYLGNNRLGWQVLEWLLKEGEDIVALVVHPEHKRKFVDEMIACSGLPSSRIFEGSKLHDPDVLDVLSELKPNIGLSVLFDYIFRPSFLDLFPQGVLNLHPSYLPYNRGQYPNVWSIVENTPAGTTLHYVNEGIDTGDIIAQQEVDVEAIDTGKSLYHKLERASLDLFRETWPDVREGSATRIPQADTEGTYHRRADVEEIDRIDPEATYTGRQLIDVLRARTFPPYRGAYFEDGDRKVYVRIDLEYGS